MKKTTKTILIGTMLCCSISAPIAIFCSLNYDRKITPIDVNYQRQDNPSSIAEADFVRKDITLWPENIFPSSFRDKSVEDFYTNSSYFDELARIIMNNPNLLFDWIPGIIDKRITSVIINTNQDNTTRMLADYEVPFHIIKQINGRLYINVAILDTKNDIHETKTFILCGFKRDSKFLLKYSPKAIEISKKISDSINYGYQIKLNKNTYDDFVNFLCSNIFYYKNHDRPTESEFQPIPPGFLKKIDNKTIKIAKFSRADQIFAPEQIPQDPDKWIVHFYSKEERKADSILFYVALGLFIVLLLSIIIYIVLVVTKRSIRL